MKQTRRLLLYIYTIPEASEADQEAVVIYIYIQYLRLVKQTRGLMKQTRGAVVIYIYMQYLRLMKQSRELLLYIYYT